MSSHTLPFSGVRRQLHGYVALASQNYCKASEHARQTSLAVFFPEIRNTDAPGKTYCYAVYSLRQAQVYLPTQVGLETVVVGCVSSRSSRRRSPISGIDRVPGLVFRLMRRRRTRRNGESA